jgi:hypothetical protein
MADSNIYALCYAQGDFEPVLLMVHRQLVQTKVAGRMVPGRIPDWADQWGTITGKPQESRSIQQAAAAIFLAQTGIDLADPHAASTYGIGASSVKFLEDSDGSPMPVFYVQCSPAGLTTLTADVQAKLYAGTPDDGVLDKADGQGLSKAREMIHLPETPDQGWRNRLIREYRDGRQPGPFNTEVDSLVRAIERICKLESPGFLIALNNIPQSGPRPSPPVGQGVETYGKIANNNPYAVNIRATVENEADWASAANRPDKTFAGVTIDAFGEIEARADLASAAHSARVRVEMTVDGDAGVVTFSYDQKAALSSANYESIGVFGSEPQYLVTQTTGTSDEVTPELTLIISENRED